MRAFILSGLLLLVSSIAACGGSSTEDGAGGANTGGSNTGGANTGGANTGGANTGGASTGGTAGGGGIAGAGGQLSCGPDAKICSDNSECVLTTQDCCLCGVPELSDFQAVNQKYTAECSCGGPICDCAVAPNPNLGATCQAGSCEGFDVRKSDPMSGCTKDEDCTLRMGVSCCEGCGSNDWDLVAVNNSGALQKAVCPSGPVGCPACAPIYPDNKKAACIQQHCAVVDK
ncbi:MAG: pentapeptide repeat-containing protein [Polyangiaceae bacterium]